MAPLRFRAWHNEKMVPANLIQVRRNQFWFKSYESDKMWKTGIVMQSTGLKDKNGKEIFEGDIVMPRWDHDESSEKYCLANYPSEVKFGHFKIEFYEDGETSTREGDGVLLNGKYTDFEDRHMEICESVEYEIIGNIYEHPHLLS